ncbi:MAG: oxidoreductase [Alphaproteobacteria bacterium]|nr:oxidoreductase [Alphaproteobacteria bacterium]
MVKTKIAVIGCGYWGKNLVRNMSELGVLVAVVDSSEQAAKAMANTYNVSALTIEEVLADSEVDGVVIASSAATHAPLAEKALRAGKHVFVEKPLALSVADAESLAKLAADKKLTLMVGHLLQYHPAFIALLQEVRGGRIGELQYAQSHRLSFGKIRTEENVLWSFAPHDISMLLAIAGEPPEKLLANVTAQITAGIADIATLHLDFASGFRAHIMASWLHPVKEHRLMVIGKKGALVFDDSNPWEQKLMFYNNTVPMGNGVPVAQKGESLAIPLAQAEPLRAECEHFLNAISSGSPVRTDAAEGIRVLEVLTAAEKSTKEQKAVKMSEAKKKYFVHETAIVDDGCEIEEGSKIWHFSHILSGTKIGKNVSVGQNVMIGPNVRVGDNCKIQNNVSLYKGVSLADGVFCGPSCVFTNVNTPRSEVERKDEFLDTPVGRGATIGANATIVCGHKIGEYCLIGAGSVVTKDVKPHALMVGNPARQIGWVSHAGDKLGKDFVCPREGRKYHETKDGILEEVIFR